MLIRSRYGALVALCLLLALPLAAQNPWDGPAFTADPKALLEAASRVEAGDFSVVKLLDEGEFVIGDEGESRSRERIMKYVVTDAGVEWSSELRASWSPWHYERPAIEARVISRDGTVHVLDQSAVVEVPAGEETDIFSDGRVLRAPLPAVAAGSIIEYVITNTTKLPIAGAGTAVHYAFGDYFPTERTRLIVDAPVASPPRITNTTGIEPRVEEKAGRRRMVFQSDRIEGERERDAYVPYDVATWRYVAFSTGKSWQTIASSYAAIVDKQIAGSDLQKQVRAAIGTSTDRKEVVAKLLAAIQKDIRYAGVEIGEGSIVPRAPRQVLANKYGDCKDKATLLVAMLRLAGFPAHVALLNAGDGFDVRPDLPALAYFNHAIVVVEGEPAIWVDPTDVYARAGELPTPDQGRMALIAKPETTTLTRTPEIESTAHVYREERTFFLPEDGKARVVEVTQPAVTSEASLRRWIAGFDPKTLREKLESYAKSAYVAKKLTSHETTDVRDLSKPFRLTLEVPESDSGVVANGGGEVVVNIAALPQHVPDALRDWKEMKPDDNPEDAPKKRTHEFLFPEPAVREWHYRIVPPIGYVPRTLPPNETKKVGVATFTQELHAEPDNTVVAKFRFDSGKRRLTVAEFQETRVAFTKFVTDNTVSIGFDQIGQAKLNAGDVRGALDEFRRLSTIHPKEAQHHIDTARALLAAGLGDAARAEARRAIAIEPKNANAHEMLGNVLRHDSLGREYRKGFDLNGAIASLRKAKELDPDDYDIRATLVRLLSYNEEGFRFGPGARVEEAVAEMQAMAKDLGEAANPMLPELTVLYGHLGRFEDMRKLAPTLTDTQQRDLAKIIATAAIDGVDAAVRELGAFDQQRKRSYASGIAQFLIQVRLYPQAAALMEIATQGTAAAAAQRQQIDSIKKLKRFEDVPRDEGPGGVMFAFFSTLLSKDFAAFKQLFPAEYMTGGGDEDDPLAELAKLDMRPPEELPVAVFRDLLASMTEVHKDGDDQTGYRLRLRGVLADATEDDDAMALFVRRENDRWIIRGAMPGDGMIGHTVLAMTAKGELEAAHQWLNWTREDAKGGSSDDPLEGEPFAALWPKAKANATVDEIRVAAASLPVEKLGWTESESILKQARDTSSEQAKTAIDLALVRIYEKRKSWSKMLEVTSRLISAHPASATAFTKHIQALLRNAKTAEATTLAKQRLEQLPKDRDALRAFSLIAAEAGDYAAAHQYAVQVVDELGPKDGDLSRAAWIALFSGQELDRAIEHAQRAAKEKKPKAGKKKEQLPALAALYAETGKSVEARTALLQDIDSGNRGVLVDGDWYVLGRIAENYGVDDYAISAYKNVKAKEIGAASVNELAKRRLEGLVAKTTTKKP